MTNYCMTGSPVVDEIGKMNITGNVIPISWFTTITNHNGKPNTNAIMILSDIVYWYRPAIERDEISGNVIGYRKKFKNDMLKRSYTGFEKLFGLSKKQIRDALVFLEELNVIKRAFRVEEIGGEMRGNVMYIELFPDALRRLTYLDEYDDSDAVTDDDNSVDIEETPCLQKDDTLFTKMSIGVYENVNSPTDTCNNINTIENNKENNIENISSSTVPLNTQCTQKVTLDDDMTEIIKSQIAYERLIKKTPSSKPFFDKCVEIMKEAYSLDDNASSKIGVNTVNNKILKEKLYKITGEHILNIYDSITLSFRPIRNEKSYILSCLFNESGKISSHKNKLKKIQGSFYFEDQRSYDFEELERMLLNKGG